MSVKFKGMDLTKVVALASSCWKIIIRTFHLLVRGFLDFVTDILFGFVNRNSSESLPPITDLILLESAKSLAAKIRNRKLKSETVVDSYITRIREVNPILNAVIDDNFHAAIRDAKKVDELIASGTKTEKELADETPFLGVPFTTKDAIKVKGLHIVIGLKSRKDVISDEDAHVVTLMRQAGAIIIAHTNVSELCMWWESNNVVYGRTNNPYNTTRIAGGSSGGEGSLLAAAGSVIGIGSDIGGSIRMPAFFNGIFGHKPSTGIVSNHGQLPEATGELKTFLSTGPMCRFASDLLPFYKVLAAENRDKLKLDTQVDVSSLRFFYMENDGGNPVISKVHPDITRAMKKVIFHFENVYGIKSQNAGLKKLKHSLPIWSMKMAGSASPSFAEEMAERNGKVNPFWELAKWFVWCSNHTLPAISLAVMENFNGPEHEDYNRFVTMCSELRDELEDLLGDDGVFLYPTHPRPAPYHNQPLLMPFNFAYTAIFNVLGVPATQCPLGLNGDGLPLGIQVIAKRNNDHLCLAVACELERAFGGWVSPSAIL